ncbi:MAG: hypothetical protein ACE5HU_09705 [Acidobacteriota bacterium]
MGAIRALRLRGGVRGGGLLIAIVICWVSASPARAIPAFARKYQTSCQTCHIAFPALTPFGEAFRLNGYRFPAGTDSSVTKNEPVSLGAEGYKKLWPRTVWPGEISGLPPVSFVIESELAYDRASRDTSFDGLGGEFAILTGGTFGDHLSFYGETEFESANGEIETSLERLNIQFRPFSTPAFQFKIGSFEPGVFLASDHRRLTDHKHLALREQIGDNAFALEPNQKGIEFFGVAAHRILYNVGYIEGRGNESNNAKDVYGRLAYKLGGMRLDGTTPGSTTSGLPSNPKPWSEVSVTFSAFVYKGRPLLSSTDTVLMNDPNTNIVSPVETTTSQNDPFTMYGGDIAINLKDLIISAGATTRRDRRPFLSDPTIVNFQSNSRWVELDWVALPWLIPASRWEEIDVEGGTKARISLTLQFLVRANVRAFLAADRVQEPKGDFTTEEVVGGVVFGM